MDVFDTILQVLPVYHGEIEKHLRKRVFRIWNECHGKCTSIQKLKGVCWEVYLWNEENILGCSFLNWKAFAGRFTQKLKSVCLEVYLWN